MIQQESQNVWGYGRGMVRTIARVTNTSDGFITLGPMLFTQRSRATLRKRRAGQQRLKRF